jgi:hypothetical protein
MFMSLKFANSAILQKSFRVKKKEKEEKYLTIDFVLRVTSAHRIARTTRDRCARTDESFSCSAASRSAIPTHKQRHTKRKNKSASRIDWTVLHT